MTDHSPQRPRRSTGCPWTTRLLACLPPAVGKTSECLRIELRQAGRYGRWAEQEFLALRNLLVIGTVGLTAALAAALSINAERSPRLLVWCAGGMAAMVAFSLPRLLLQGAAKARLARIQTGLPDALDMVTMCMTGGLSLHHALSRVSDELRVSHDDVATELCIIRRHADAHSLEHAMEQFSQRIDVPEVKSLSALVTQAERLGANVGDALRDFADGVRRAFRQRAEEKGNRTSVKMLLPVSLCLAPPVYILLLAPALLELRDFVTRENRPGGVLAPAPEGLNSSGERLTASDDWASGR